MKRMSSLACGAIVVLGFSTCGAMCSSGDSGGQSGASGESGQGGSGQGGSSVGGGGQGGAQSGGSGQGGQAGGGDCSVTIESLDAANEALKNGATEVNLDSGGCIVYRRSVADGIITHEEVVGNGETWLTFDHSAAETNGRLSARLADYIITAKVVRGATPADIVVTLTWGDPMVERYTYTDSGTGIHVVQEWVDTEGTILQEEYDSDYVQAASVSVESGTGPQGCTHTPDKAAALKSNMEAGLAKGVRCLKDMGLEGRAGLILRGAANGIKIICQEPGKDNWNAKLNYGFHPLLWWNDVYRADRPIEILVQSDSSGITDSLLFHELMHTIMNPHSEVTRPNPDKFSTTLPWSHTDRVYACQQTCFDPDADQCTCAACVNLEPKKGQCPSQCASKKACTRPDTYRCACPKESEYGGKVQIDFLSSAECEGACPSGMGCFVTHCKAFPNACQQGGGGSGP